MLYETGTPQKTNLEIQQNQIIRHFELRSDVPTHQLSM